MAKKKSCQNIRVPRVLFVVERELYGWVDEETFTQPSMIEADALPELRREMRLTADRAAEGDYVLEVAGPSDRLPFQAQEDRVHFLWIYSELFTRLGVRLPFTDFQKEVLFRCQVAASQLHLNGWGFLRTFERGRKLFDSFEESIQEFKWHYFKVLPLPGRRPLWLNEEGAPFPWVYWNAEDPTADLRQKRRKRKVSEASAEEAALEGDFAWKHKVNLIDRALPSDYNFRAALDAGLTNAPIREVGVEKTFAAKVQFEKELAAAREEAEVLTAERDSALTAPLLHAKIKSLTEDLQRAEGDRLSATARMEEVERKAKVQAAELESCHSALAQEEKKVEFLTQSLKGKQKALDEAEAAAVHWRDEWRSLGEETREMVQETFEILMDQVCHLNPAIDYLMITLDTCWDPKAKRIYNPKAEAQDQPEPVVEQPELEAEEQRAEEVVAGEGGVGYVPSPRNLASFYGAEFVGALSECLDYPVGTLPVCS
ncbi:hypothetical protein PIB30_086634 [Stylosanthes scabra]|uniref:Uncharacterized protein n=1 Tax=Stylosanthes scabra TaxID=79078 RepID=A0ABU6QVI8_9FABA|nr:hypothetical protein [Stylosanthes scabra]